MGKLHLSVIESLLCFSFPIDSGGGGSVVLRGGFPLCLWISAVSNTPVLSVTTSPVSLLLALDRPVPGVPDGTDMTTNVLPDFFAHPCSSVRGDVPGVPAHRPSSLTRFATLLFVCGCTCVQPVLHAFRHSSAIKTVPVAE